jgi:hypothetical protein
MLPCGNLNRNAKCHLILQTVSHHEITMVYGIMFHLISRSTVNFRQKTCNGDSACNPGKDKPGTYCTS